MSERPSDRAAEGVSPVPASIPNAVEKLQGISFALGAGGLEETDLDKLAARIEWGVDHIQQVEAQRTADLIEELSKSPRTTWGQVKTAVLNRAGVRP